MLSYFQTKNNNVKQFVIDFAFNEITYDFKINDNLKMFFDLSSKNFNRLKLIKREKIEIVMIFVNVINKTRYNLYYKIFDDLFKIDSMMYLRFHQNYTISKLFNKKFFNQKINFFKILKIVKIFKQTFRLKLSSIIKIHFVIFIAQLKFVTFDLNSYNKLLKNNSSSIKKNNFDSKILYYEIKRLLNKRINRNQF